MEHSVRRVLRVILGGLLGLGIVLILTLVLPTPQGPESSPAPRSGFLLQDAPEGLSLVQLENQFLFADLDAQQSAVAEERLLGEVDADFAQFYASLTGDEQRKSAIRDALVQAHRELTDFRLAQSMGAMGSRQMAYKPAANYVLSRLRPALSQNEIIELETLMRRNAWEKFKPSYRGQAELFARQNGLDFTKGEIDHLVATHFESSYALLNPHALEETSQRARLSLQREALERTRQALGENLSPAQRAVAEQFIDAQLAEFESLAARVE